MPNRSLNRAVRLLESVGMKYRPNRYTSTENAISLFDRFVQQWVAPALHDMMFGHPRNDAELVRRARRPNGAQRHARANELPLTE